jgi:hypothetical protein
MESAWRRYEDDDGDAYYACDATGESYWEAAVALHDRAGAAEAAPDAVWRRCATDEGDTYFACAATGETRWELSQSVREAWGAALDRARAEGAGLRERARADAASLRAQRKELDTLRVDSEARLSEYALGMAAAEAE